MRKYPQMDVVSMLKSKDALVSCRNLSFQKRFSFTTISHGEGSYISSVSWVHAELTFAKNAGCLTAADDSFHNSWRQYEDFIPGVLLAIHDHYLLVC
jgi:hypothetical protein